MNIIETIKLNAEYERVVKVYIDAFCKKHDCYVEYAIGECDDIQSINDCFLSFSDIKYDIDAALPNYVIWEWYYYSVEQHLYSQIAVNLKNYLSIKQVGLIKPLAADELVTENLEKIRSACKRLAFISKAKGLNE